MFRLLHQSMGSLHCFQFGPAHALPLRFRKYRCMLCPQMHSSTLQTKSPSYLPGGTKYQIDPAGQYLLWISLGRPSDGTWIFTAPNHEKMTDFNVYALAVGLSSGKTQGRSPLLVLFRWQDYGGRKRINSRHWPVTGRRIPGSRREGMGAYTTASPGTMNSVRLPPSGSVVCLQ